jgi:hypothetical protein
MIATSKKFIVAKKSPAFTFLLGVLVEKEMLVKTRTGDFLIIKRKVGKTNKKITEINKGK